MRGKVGELLLRKDDRGVAKELIEAFELNHLLDRQVADLSGGELQRFCLCAACIQNASVYMFDEPSSYLDVKQRIHAAKIIRNLVDVENYIIVVRRLRESVQRSLFPARHSEPLGFLPSAPRAGRARLGGGGLLVGLHLLSLGKTRGIRSSHHALLRQRRHQRLSRRIHSHGKPSISHRSPKLPPFHRPRPPRRRSAGTPQRRTSDATAKCRKKKVEKKRALNSPQDAARPAQRLHFFEYPSMRKTLGTFKLSIEGGNFCDSEIIVMLGQNGTGKSTFIR